MRQCVIAQAQASQLDPKAKTNPEIITAAWTAVGQESAKSEALTAPAIPMGSNKAASTNGEIAR